MDKSFLIWICVSIVFAIAIATFDLLGWSLPKIIASFGYCGLSFYTLYR